MKKNNKRLFIVRKYIFAQNAQKAINKDKRTPVHDVWIDDDWRKKQETRDDVIGFETFNDEE